MAKKRLTPKSQDLSKWYTEVIQQARLADYSPVKGCMVMRPNGYGIWENIQKTLDPLLKNLGVENAYFPLFIPLSFLHKEAEHVQGFSPQLAIVTHAGGKKLEEELVVRPTSETIMYEMYHRWIHSHRDLPLILNQWNNVVRWEKRTYFFLRTTEFLWQEAHTAHANHKEAFKMVLDGLESYRCLVEEYLAIPVIKGRKSLSEKFAGSNMTTTIEAMMPDGKALQAGTSHDLGQNFSKKEVFDISFLNEKGEIDYAWQTCFGLTTRIIGALIMVHGDNDGLVLPPKIATTQVVVIPTEDKRDVNKLCENLVEGLKKECIRVKIMSDNQHRLGWKLNEAEIQGIPLILVVGQEELNGNYITAKFRHNGKKTTFKLESAINEIVKNLDSIQSEMFRKAIEIRDAQLNEVNTYAGFKTTMEKKKGFLKAFWCEEDTCEKLIKEETKATTRCLPFVDNDGNVLEEQGKCIKCGKPAKHRWLFAQAY